MVNLSQSHYGCSRYQALLPQCPMDPVQSQMGQAPSHFTAQGTEAPRAKVTCSRVG